MVNIVAVGASIEIYVNGYKIGSPESGSDYCPCYGGTCAQREFVSSVYSPFPNYIYGDQNEIQVSGNQMPILS